VFVIGAMLFFVFADCDSICLSLTYNFYYVDIIIVKYLNLPNQQHTSAPLNLVYFLLQLILTNCQWILKMYLLLFIFICLL